MYPLIIFLKVHFIMNMIRERSHHYCIWNFREKYFILSYLNPKISVQIHSRPLFKDLTRNDVIIQTTPKPACPGCLTALFNKRDNVVLQSATAGNRMLLWIGGFSVNGSWPVADSISFRQIVLWTTERNNFWLWRK